MLNRGFWSNSGDRKRERNHLFRFTLNLSGTRSHDTFLTRLPTGQNITEFQNVYTSYTNNSISFIVPYFFYFFSEVELQLIF